MNRWGPCFLAIYIAFPSIYLCLLSGQSPGGNRHSSESLLGPYVVIER